MNVVEVGWLGWMDGRYIRLVSWLDWWVGCVHGILRWLDGRRYWLATGKLLGGLVGMVWLGGLVGLVITDINDLCQRSMSCVTLWGTDDGSDSGRWPSVEFSPMWMLNINRNQIRLIGSSMLPAGSAPVQFGRSEICHVVYYFLRILNCCSWLPSFSSQLITWQLIKCVLSCAEP